MRYDLVVGIDNGNTGACCVLKPSSEVLSYCKLPTHKPHVKTEVDAEGLTSYIQSFNASNVLVGIEEPLVHAPSSQSMRSMSINLGLCVGRLSAEPNITIKRVEVKDWQRSMLGAEVPAGKTKQFALAKAQKIWPSELWLASARSRLPHDGIVDAALIAYYLIHHHPMTS